jgi:hypothetical protein
LSQAKTTIRAHQGSTGWLAGQYEEAQQRLTRRAISSEDLSLRFAAANLAILMLCLTSGCMAGEFHSPGRPYSGTRVVFIDLGNELSCFPSAPLALRLATPVVAPFMVFDLLLGAAVETVLLPVDLVVEPQPQPEHEGRWGKKSCEEGYSPPKEAPLPAQPAPSQTPSS